MLQWLEIIVDFFINHAKMVFEFFKLFQQSNTAVAGAFVFAPSFLQPILVLSLALCVILWVVNLF